MTCPFCSNSDLSLIETQNISKFIEGKEVKVIICDCQVCSKRWVVTKKEE